MKNKQLVSQLKNYDDVIELKVILRLEKYSVDEICYHNGVWYGHNFFCTSITNWKRSELQSDSMDIETLINLLKKKTISEMDSNDFYDLSVLESSDGSVEVEDIEWDEHNKPTEEDLDDLNKHDLYWDSEITDSEYKFESGSIWFIEIEVNGDKYNIEN